MKTPFWWQTKHPVAITLWPLSLFWRLVSTLRGLLSKAERLDVPVWCVGNVTAGGGGKTPFCLYLGKQAQKAGINAYFISRGYGGNLPGPLLVDPHKHTSDEVGDEALLLAGLLPTIVAHKRIEAAKLAFTLGAQLLILDDGLQYPYLHKDKTFLMLKGDKPFGNGLMMPAGPLRQPISQAVKQSDVIIRLNGPEVTHSSYDIPIWQATTFLQIPKLPDTKVVAFAGIAHPEDFKNGLIALGINVVDFHSFADHHAYNDDDIKQLISKAAEHNTPLLTTKKDWVRLSPEARQQVIAIDQTLKLKQENDFQKILTDAN